MNGRSSPQDITGARRKGRARSRRPSLRAGLLACCVALWGAAAVGQSGAGERNGAEAGAPVFVELFTSQGCSSCPPADKILGELAGRPDVIAVSFAVDYWDNLGWRDTFGSRANSERQRAYAKQMGEGMVYTPQMVIDGRQHLNGGDRAGVTQAVDQRLREQQPGIALAIVVADDKLHVRVGAGDKNSQASRATLWILALSHKQEVAVRSGENSGRELTYHNVVHAMMPIGEWSGAPLDLTLQRGDVMSHGGDRCVVVLQKNNGGPVLAVAALDPR